MYCKKCGNIISNAATFCEHCGHPTQENTHIFDNTANKSMTENRKKNIVGLILAVVAGLLVCAVVLIATNSLGGRTPDPSPLLSAPAANDNANGDGTYKVGTDIEAGEYYIYCTNYNSCYFEVSADSSGKLTSIVTNDNIETFAFVTVKEGQYLKVSGGKILKAADATLPGADTSGNYGAGMYRVGIDIPAGEYKVTCVNGRSCYIEVSSDSTGSLYSIVSNDNIDTFSYITVADSQYLTVHGGQFAPAT